MVKYFDFYITYSEEKRFDSLRSSKGQEEFVEKFTRKGGPKRF